MCVCVFAYVCVHVCVRNSTALSNQFFPLAGTIAFVGSHLDVVPANPETWERNPFKLVVEVRHIQLHTLSLVYDVTITHICRETSYMDVVPRIVLVM